MTKDRDASSRQYKECNDEWTEDPPQPEQLQTENHGSDDDLPTLIVSDHQIVIRGGDEVGSFGGDLVHVPDFVSDGKLTVFEGCMIYTDQNPAVYDLFAFPDGNRNGASTRHMRIRLDILGAKGGWPRDAYGNPMGPANNDQEQVRNEVYREIERDIKANRITLLRPAYCYDDPEVFDPTRCTITLDAILDIGRRRGDGGKWMTRLLARAEPPGSQTRRGYIPLLEKFLDQVADGTAMSDDALAGQFIAEVDARREFGEQMPYLPQKRNIAIQVGKILNRRPGTRALRARSR